MLFTQQTCLRRNSYGLQEDVAEAMSEAYTNVMESYNESVKSDDVASGMHRDSGIRKRIFHDFTRTSAGQ